MGLRRRPRARAAAGPDLSNTNVVLDALNDAGPQERRPGLPARRGSSCSACRTDSETNPLPWAGDDGGFVYGIDAKGQANSAAGEYDGPDGRPMVRSYGSMTYGGLKSSVR